jgi:hypothetical protein
VIRGFEDVVSKIAEVATDEKDRPAVPVTIYNCGELELRKKPAPPRSSYFLSLSLERSRSSFWLSCAFYNQRKSPPRVLASPRRKRNGRASATKGAAGDRILPVMLPKATTASATNGSTSTSSERTRYIRPLVWGKLRSP